VDLKNVFQVKEHRGTASGKVKKSKSKLKGRVQTNSEAEEEKK
jgi:hypothetical protein